MGQAGSVKRGKRKNTVKKWALAALVIAAVTAGYAWGGANRSDAADGSGKTVTLTVGASPTPHAEILQRVAEEMKAEGYNLVIREFTDYVLPNTALDSGDIDANYFQHQPYLDQFNKENKTNIVSVARVHYEPFGLYPGKKKSLDEVSDGSQVAVPNDTTNEARALHLLQAAGWIKLADGVGLEATKKDITDNPKNLDIVEIEAAQLPRSLRDVDYAVINGNYAIEAGFNVAKDALVSEKSESLAAQTYANIVAVKSGSEDKPEIQALVRALQSDKIRAFISEKYEGAVVPSK
jgi:D-methionine transport system substrate-binding protein